MTSQTFKEISKDFYEYREDLKSDKEREYSVPDDRFINFKRIAEKKGETPSQALIGLAYKQWLSIEDWINEGFYGSKELLNEKMGDWMIYCELLYGIFMEELINRQEASNDKT